MIKWILLFSLIAIGASAQNVYNWPTPPPPVAVRPILPFYSQVPPVVVNVGDSFFDPSFQLWGVTPYQVWWETMIKLNYLEAIKRNQQYNIQDWD